MCQRHIIDFLESDKAFFTTKLLKQHWRQDKYSYRTRPRPDYGLMLLLHGEVKLVTENSSLIARAGDIVFLPKYSYYEAVFESEAEDCLINFDATDADFKIEAPVRLLQNTPLSCTEGFETLIEEDVLGKRSVLKLKGLFYMLIDSVVSSYFTQSSAESKMIEKAKELLRSENEIRISEIARECGISESGLRKKFKEVVGCSPTECRLAFKLNKAKYLLEATDLNVGEIADMLHFYDAAYFCKMFKTYTGISPMQFAKRKQL